MSNRFGSDKLDTAAWGGPGDATLLDVTLTGLPRGWDVVLVGPARPTARQTARTVRWTREQPPGAGPARAVHAGLVALARDGGPAPDDVVVVLPGDAPDAGLAVPALLAGLAAHPAGVLGRGPDGRLQPLHLALPATAVAAVLADPPEPGTSARRLAHRLGLVPVPVPAAAVLDVDTPADLARWRAARAAGTAD